MTAIAPSAPVRTRLRLTTRGRRVVAAVLALAFGIVLGLMLVHGPAALATADSASVTFQTVTVGAGESLWSIAQSVAPDADPRDVIDDIMRLNLLTDPTLSAGQQLAIPTQYASVP